MMIYMDTSTPTTGMVSIDSLRADPKNPRTITTHDFESLQRSIDEFGFLQPVIVNRRNMTICGGHQRVLAARAIGMTEVPVTWVDLDDEHQSALNIALNHISGSFDNDQLAELLSSLDADLVTLTGFDEDWADLLQPAPLEELDEPKSDVIKAPKFTTDDLRVMAKAIYPTQEAVIMDFLKLVDERTDRH